MLIISDASVFTLVVQVTAVITSFMSLSLGFMTYRDDVEYMQGRWTWKDMAVDMVWNILSISPRVIALVLFASYQLYWFWGLVITHIVGVTVFVFIVTRFMTHVYNLFESVFYSIVSGMVSIFTLFVTLFVKVRFHYYLLYWIVTFVENTVMISLWYQWSSDFGFWYHG